MKIINKTKQNKTKQINSSKVVTLLVNTCRKLHTRGIDVNCSLLKINKPNHSNRDYSAALDLFNNDEVFCSNS